MGRAIVRNPKVFLMYEPLSSLDAKLRGQLRVEIAGVYNKLNTTFVYVTHDQGEAMTLGTKIVGMMKDGVIQQVDSPENLLKYPDNKFVAGFIGNPKMNFIESKTVFSKDENYFEVLGSKVEIAESKLNKKKENVENGSEVILGIRPEDICIASE